MPRSKKGLGRCHKSGTGKNQGRRRMTPRDNQGFNRNDCHSKRIEMSLPVISVSLPLNHSVINPPQLSLVCQQLSRSSHNSPRDNKWLDNNHINSKSNKLSSPVIPTLPPWNDPFIIQLSCPWFVNYDGNWQIKYQAHNITTNSYFIRRATFQEGFWGVQQKWNLEQSG